MSERGTMSLQTAPPAVTLRNAPSQPFDGAIAAARTCYSPRVVAASEVTDRQRDSIGSLTFDAGHHTVYQHAHFEFGLGSWHEAALDYRPDARHDVLAIRRVDVA